MELIEFLLSNNVLATAALLLVIHLTIFSIIVINDAVYYFNDLKGRK
jgi:hypothetical protein